MNLKKLMMIGAGLVLAGCCCKPPCCPCKDTVVGNWGLKLPYDRMSAGHMIVTRSGCGKYDALVLWRWASPNPMTSCEIRGNKFCIVHPWGMILDGEVCGDKLTGTITYLAKDGTRDQAKPQEIFTGWRNPPIEPSHTALAKLGEPIDLLKDGLDGWEPMEKGGKFGWKFKDGVLSNELGLNEKGEWVGGGANLKTKREDFYDFNLEYDVRVPAKSNSGVYLRGRYECQVVDSFGKPVDEHHMAAYYGRVVPSVAAEKPAGEWQHVNVTLYKRHLTVVLNGKTIIDNVPVVGITGGAIDANEFVPGPIYLQGDHSDADYKNMILRPAL